MIARLSRSGGSRGAITPGRPILNGLLGLKSPAWPAPQLGQLIQGVGVAREMTRLTSSTDLMALFQTAMMLQQMIVAIPTGAVADIFDRRKVAMSGLAFASACAALLTALASFGLTKPWILLAFCSLIDAGVALYSPARQASVIEQVKVEDLPAAVGLGSISYNIARSFGPALGGVIVAALGATAAFGINAVLYLPLLAILYLWKRRDPAGNRAGSIPA